MATRFYLPVSGSAPLGSLAVDSQWELEDSLTRLPTFTTKQNTSLTQVSATWSSATTQQWVWRQWQSKPMTAAYDWTTSDTVSMVIKVAESIAQGDSHLCYVIRVVSGDGATIRGIVGAYLTTSSEYPTSLATIATRIHSARTDGATNFSSQIGDRIIIEIGHHGVSPSTSALVYHNYGDPSATEDYALTAGLTTDLCPWVELSRTVAFDTPASDSQAAYTKGSSVGLDSQAAYVDGGIQTFDSQPAYVKGGTQASDSQIAYTNGQTNAIDNQNAFIQGSSNLVSHIDGYTKGSAEIIDNISAYTLGSIFVNDSQSAYLEGSTVGGDISGSHNVFVLGLDNVLVPNGDLSASGIWWNELNNTNNLYQSIDEYPTADDDDYIWDTDPTVGHYYECSLSNPSGTPGSGDVIIVWRGKDKSGLNMLGAKVELRQGSTVIASKMEPLYSTAETHYFQLTPAEKASITDWTDLRLRILPDNSSRMMAMVQGSDLWQQANSQTYIDNLISEVQGRVTDIAVLCYLPSGSNRPVLGESTLCYETTVSIGGLKPLTYLCNEAAAAGIRVWAWFVFMYSSNWCGTTGMLLDPIPDTTDYRTPGYIILYGVESSRTKIANAMIDFMEQNSGLSGMILDYIRTDGIVDQNASDITALVQEISVGVPSGMQLGFFSLASTRALSSNKQDGKTWVDNRYVDFVVSMNYNGAWFDKWDCLRDLTAVPLYLGVSSELCENSASGYLARLSAFRERGHRYFADFQWSSGGMWDAPNNFLDAITDYNNWISPTMENVTSLSCNWQAGGSLSFIIGGVTRTINYDDVTDHTIHYALKDHIEALYGELPWLWFDPQTGYISLDYGDRSVDIE